MPVEQGPECAAGADRTELAVIADHDHLGLGQVAGGQEAEHVAVVGYPGLVEHDDVPPSELQGAVVEAPQERGDRTALGEVGFAAPIFGRLGTLVGGIGVAGPSERLSGKARESAIATAVGEAARAISRDLGAQRWPPI